MTTRSAVMSETGENGFDRFLRPTSYIDSDHPDVVAFAARVVEGASSDMDKALKLYYAVRDGIRYDPYRIVLEPEAFTASACLERGYGFCITKSVLLTAASRASGVPCRLGFADVRNHLATQRLLDLQGTDLFIFHGYVELFLEEKWVKATPVFNLSLCEKFRVLPLEFDGRNDSIFHPHDADGRRHMEYVSDRGSFADLPFDDVKSGFIALYPNIYGSGQKGGAGGDFDAEAEAEN